MTAACLLWFRGKTYTAAYLNYESIYYLADK